MSIQLSRPEDYDGGDLELMLTGQTAAMDRTRGALIVFPSFTLRRFSVARGVPRVIDEGGPPTPYS